jgi:hypothetical protein
MSLKKDIEAGSSFATKAVLYSKILVQQQMVVL